MPEEKRVPRIVRCPACQRYYRISAGPPTPGIRLRCTKCGAVFTLDDGPEANPAASPVNPAAAALGAPLGRVLVATDGQEFQTLIDEVLATAGFELRQASSGLEAWGAIGIWRPHVALLDVALPEVPAFEICDRVRADAALRGMGLILIASVFQRTRYKRAPTSLYGADDYIEKHHIRDWLAEKIGRLLPAARGTAPEGSRVPAPVVVDKTPPVQATIDDHETETLIREEFRDHQGKGYQGLERLRESLRRYARIIVSDIALYNQELVEQGIREGTLTKLLHKELEEGRQLYLTRVPPSTAGVDYYGEAVREFIAKRSGGQAAPPRGRSGHGHH